MGKEDLEKGRGKAAGGGGAWETEDQEVRREPRDVRRLGTRIGRGQEAEVIQREVKGGARKNDTIG